MSLFTVEHHVYFHADLGVLTTLADIRRDLQQLTKEGKAMNQKLTDLLAAVAAQTGEIQSMKTFIAGLEQAVKDALSGVTLPPAVEAALDTVFADVNTNTQAIKDAIDNDPATPPAP